ncbi:MAG: HAD family phosphatase [Selenomonadaceae bacterium]|nr:HAD family phosphatase [Selenomonadaceae bacterium]MBR6342837.1 HAD family phosphatase [Selenomonadaceae bacterium]MBR6905664.1 HAD family phosphatase [Selenomonadaceae bacterium]
MYRLIACDLDETLLNSERKVSAGDVEAIRKFGELGGKFVLATGRGYASVAGTLEEIGLLGKEKEYVISFNGGAITENKGNRLIHFDGISFALAQQLFARGLQYDVCIHVYTKEVVHVYRLFDGERDYISGRMEIEEFFEDNLDFLKGQDIVKVLYVNTDPDYLRRIEEDLRDITGDVDVSYSSNRYIEFNHKGVTKGAGLLRLAELLGIPREETIAVGDNFNDLSMIRDAGLGVGVQNAVEGIRGDCDYITEATHDENAIAEVIEKFVLKA